jgi:glycosyltransferase involved in cell wall biosynthesis
VREQPIVSVGIPVYNGELYLARTLESILEQSFSDFEVIISDNASTDETEAICREFARRDDRIRYHRRESNLGWVGNFNSLPPRASGAYFKWAAADDLLTPTYLEGAVRSLRGTPGAVVAAPRARYIDEHGQEITADKDSGRFVTEDGEVLQMLEPLPELASEDPVARFRAVVLGLTANLLATNLFGLIDLEALRKTCLIERYVGSDKVLLARLSFMGPLLDVPERAFLRRFHPEHLGRRSPREQATMMNPGRKLTLLLPESVQIGGYLRAISGSDLSWRQRLLCRSILIQKLGSVALRRIRATARPVLRRP